MLAGARLALEKLGTHGNEPGIQDALEHLYEGAEKIACNYIRELLGATSSQVKSALRMTCRKRGIK